MANQNTRTFNSLREAEEQGAGRQNALTQSLEDAFSKLEGTPSLPAGKVSVEHPNVEPINLQAERESHEKLRKVEERSESEVTGKNGKAKDQDDKRAVQEKVGETQTPESKAEPEESEETEEESYDDSDSLDALKKLAELGDEVDDEDASKTPEDGAGEVDDAEVGKHTRADDDDSKEEIESIRNDPHTNPKTKKSIDRLLGKISSLKAELKRAPKAGDVEALKAKVAELESAGSKVDPVSDQERQELTMLRRRFALETDPEIKKNFDDRIKSAQGVIEDIVKSTVTERDFEAIQKDGAVTYFSRHPEQWRQLVDYLEDKRPMDADVLRAKFAEARTLERDKTSKIQELSKDAKEWEKAQREKAAQTQEQQKKQHEQVAQMRQNIYKEITEKDKLFSPVPEKGLEGEALKKAQAENKRRERYRVQVQKMLSPKSIDEQIATVYRASLAPVFADKLKDAQTRIKKLEGELSKIREKRDITPPKQKESAAPKQEKRDLFGALDALERGEAARPAVSFVAAR